MASVLGKRVVLQSAATSGNGTAADIGDAPNGAVIYCEGAGTITSGAVTIEEALSTDYSGTWSSLSVVTASGLTGGAAQAVHLSPGVYNAVRARISTTIGGGGSVTCTIEAN